MRKLFPEDVIPGIFSFLLDEIEPDNELAIVCLKEISKCGKESKHPPLVSDVKIFQEALKLFPNDKEKRLLYYFDNKSEYLLSKFFNDDHKSKLIFHLYETEQLDKKDMLEKLVEFNIINLVTVIANNSKNINLRKVIFGYFLPILKSKLFEINDGLTAKIYYSFCMLVSEELELLKNFLDLHLLPKELLNEMTLYRFHNAGLKDSQLRIIRNYVTDKDLLDKIDNQLSE